jgi:matrixin
MSVSAGGSAYSPELDGLRQALRAGGVKNVELVSAEILVAADSAGWQGATTLIANNRTHTLSSTFVPSDPRRGGGANISYLVDQSDGSALSRTNTGAIVLLPNTVVEPQIDASMLRWQNQPRCGAPMVVKVPDSGADPDLIDGLVFGDPALIGTPFADVTHAGWLPGAFFDAVAPNGSTFILGVTFTFIFVDAAGNPTDIDRDRRADAAFREIYYNRNLPWTTDATNPRSYDIQSVVTHEAGHAYGLGHFGKVFIDNNDVIKFAPRAVMNAVYISPFRDLAGTDNGSFCQLWANAKIPK